MEIIEVFALHTHPSGSLENFFQLHKSDKGDYFSLVGRGYSKDYAIIMKHLILDTAREGYTNLKCIKITALYKTALNLCFYTIE